MTTKRILLKADGTPATKAEMKEVDKELRRIYIKWLEEKEQELNRLKEKLGGIDDPALNHALETIRWEIAYHKATQE